MTLKFLTYDCADGRVSIMRHYPADTGFGRDSWPVIYVAKSYHEGQAFMVWYAKESGVSTFTCAKTRSLATAGDGETQDSTNT